MTITQLLGDLSSVHAMDALPPYKTLALKSGRATNTRKNVIDLGAGVGPEKIGSHN